MPALAPSLRSPLCCRLGFLRTTIHNASHDRGEAVLHSGLLPAPFNGDVHFRSPFSARLMISIDEAYVDSAAPNAEAMKNGRGLVVKGKFVKLHVSDDQTLLFGECQGSGKDPYRCSSDFARAEAPTH